MLRLCAFISTLWPHKCHCILALHTTATSAKSPPPAFLHPWPAKTSKSTCIHGLPRWPSYAASPVPHPQHCGRWNAVAIWHCRPPLSPPMRLPRRFCILGLPWPPNRFSFTAFQGDHRAPHPRCNMACIALMQRCFSALFHPAFSAQFPSPEWSSSSALHPPFPVHRLAGISMALGPLFFIENPYLR